MTGDGLGAALRKLRELGFVPVRRRGSARCFEGALACTRGPVRARIEVDDWDFVDYPTIRLLERPPFLPKIVPHIAATGGMCYFTPGEVVLDRYRPEHAIWQCIDQARKELDRLAANPNYRQAEFQTEFGASWYSGQEPLPWQVMLGTIGPDAQQANAYIVGDTDQYLVVTSRTQEVEGLCRVRGWAAPEPAAATCWVVRSECLPALPATLPATVGEAFGWIREWDQAAYKTIQHVLKQRAYLAAANVLFVLQTRAGWFGFQLALNPFMRQAYRRKPSAYRQYLHGKGAADAIERLAIEEVGADHVHSRNLSFSNLKDRNVTVIGCGAIGGYVAHALAKLGAGSGSFGRLVLIDPERLMAGNAGRHLLGLDNLFDGKAAAIKNLLERQFPASTIESHGRGVVFPGDLKGDLVVEATGEEALSEAINFHRLGMPLNKRPPVLYVCVVGEGKWVQALWTDSPRYACFRCLRRNDAARTKRFNQAAGSEVTPVRGCQAFTPYAVSAPMMATALAIELVIDWLTGSPAPRFRTLAVGGNNVPQIKNQDLRPLKDCPACGNRS